MTTEHSYREWQVVSDGQPGEYLTDRLGKEAIQFIKENQNRPFFLYLAHYAVHTPIMAKPELIEKYRAKTPDAISGQNNPKYAAMIESVDDSVGSILETLQELGLDENTIVVFTSDNGGARNPSNYPWRGAKGNFYEGGIRVPTLLKWPGQVAPGTTSDEVIISPDFYPTSLVDPGRNFFLRPARF